MTTRIHPSFNRCMRKFQLRSIKTAEQHRQAVAMIESFVGKDDSMDAGEVEYFDTLVDLIEKYESSVVDIPEAPKHRIIQRLMEARGMSQADLARAIGTNRSTVSEILKGKDRISKTIAVGLANHFKTSTDLFIR